MIEGRATARYIRGSAQKAGLVLDLIRGKDVDKAMSTLRYVRKGVAKDVEKVLRSAVANAQQKEGGDSDVERLYVRECYADQGPTLKRIRAAPMGRAFRILKRSSHLTVSVGRRSEAVKIVTRVSAPDTQAAPIKKAAARKAVGEVKKKLVTKTRKKKAAKRASAGSTKAAPKKAGVTRKKTTKKSVNG